MVAASQALFGRGSLRDLSPATLRAALGEAGLLTVPELAPGRGAVARRRAWSGACNEARRAITEGGAYVNNVRVSDVDAVVASEALLHGRFLVLRRGKRTFAGVEVTR